MFREPYHNRPSICQGLLGIVLALACLASAYAQTTPPDPYAIFSGARSYWMHQHYPVRIGYTITVDITEDTGHKVEHYASAYDAVKDVVAVNPLSDYEQEHPASGEGVNWYFGIQNLGTGILLTNPDPPLDFIGVPSLAPNYSFAIGPFVPSDAGPKPPPVVVHEVRVAFHDPGASPTPSPEPSGLQQIASVTADQRRYTITLVGIEPIDGAPMYHLKLKPIRDGGRYRLRDMWVDTSTYATRRIVNAGNFVDGPWPRNSWTINFASVAGALYISDEETTKPVTYYGVKYLDTRVSFGDLAPQPKQPIDDVALYKPQEPDRMAREPGPP